ncbi:MAG TPA: hypothetical protein VGU45_03430 [Microvirga sp.]|jgi:hypothetical protein|nr:hypothetical protein [Microvirga sp.]
MGEFVVQKLPTFWAVTSGEVIFGRYKSATEAIRGAVETASAVAGRGRAARVVFDDPDDGIRVIWDSSRDGFSHG